MSLAGIPEELRPCVASVVLIERSVAEVDSVSQSATIFTLVR